MTILTSADGTDIRAFDEGQGPVILIIHPGLDDGKSWGKVAARLSDRFRVVRLVRRHYRLDLPIPSAYSIIQEVRDVLKLAKAIGKLTLIVGHSSGGVVALKALAASPGTFAGAVLFEPPVATGPPADSDAINRAKAALADDRPGRAMQIFAPTSRVARWTVPTASGTRMSCGTSAGRVPSCPTPRPSNGWWRIPTTASSSRPPTEDPTLRNGPAGSLQQLRQVGRDDRGQAHDLTRDRGRRTRGVPVAPQRTASRWRTG